MIKPWPQLGTEELGNFRIFSLEAHTNMSPKNGHSHTFYVIDTLDWINVVPVTPEGELLMIRQFRHGSREITLEVPGGMVDPGETPLNAAVRELREETGYAGDKVTKIGEVSPNPAIFNNRCHTFLVENAVRVGDQQFDGTEDIEFSLHSPAEVNEIIGRGEITHALTLNAIYFYERHLRLDD